jgi:hypothetical protein
MSLDVFLNNTAVTQTVDLVDEQGNALNVTAVEYRVINQDGIELVPRQPLTSFAEGDASATVTIPANLNALASGHTREIRSVELICRTDAGTISFSANYCIEAIDPLAIPNTSFQSYAMAQLTAMDIPNIEAWNNASESQRIAALMDAREHIVQLNFNLLNSNVNFGQDQLAYVPEGSFQSSYVARNSLFIFNGNLGILNATQFQSLPDKFKRALRQAQVVEADYILSGVTDEHRRTSGIIEDEIGESRQKYRDTVPLRLPVCRRALGFLSYYVTFAKRIGRA